MTAPETYIPTGTELKVVTPVTEPAMHAVPGHELLSEVLSAADSSAAKKFSISYFYKGEFYHTQAIQTGTGVHAFYKVVLGSKVSGFNTLCWIQKREDHWAILLGNNISDDLLHAIAAAIENR